MAKLRRGRAKEEKPKPEVVTGSFELHYEDIISRNRFAIIAVFATALVLLAAFVPGAVYHSVAEPDKASVEIETGTVINPGMVIKVKGDITASDDSYIEFRAAPEQ